MVLLPSRPNLRARHRSVVAVALALVVAAGGCASGDAEAPTDLGPTREAPAPTEAEQEPGEAAPTEQEPTPESTTVAVQVYFTNEQLGDPCTEVFARPRAVPADDALTGALEALLSGPDDAERAEGYSGWFADETSGMLRSAEVVAGTVMVDLADLRPVIPNASTSCGSSALLAQLDTTALAAADGAASVLYLLNGEHDVFYEWLQLVPPGRAVGGTDLADGRHPALLHAADLPGRTLTVDVIQFLTGQEARDVYRADHPEDPDGPPNDYVIVNANPQLRTLPVATAVDVQLVLLHRGEGPELKPSQWETLLDDLAGGPSDPDLLSFSPFWLTLEGGVVTAIEEQYLP